jgi:Tfp pilus assembly protein PilN
MIRINLLGTPKPKKGKGGGAPAFAGEGPNALLLLIVAIVLGLGAFGYLYYNANKEAVAVQDKIDAENREAARLADIDKKFEQRQREKDAFEKRVKVIDQLKAEQSGPVDLLTTIGDTVNASDAVWLKNMKDSGSSITLEGNALTTIAVANFMTNLKNTGYFKNIEIKSAQQEKNKDMTQYSFSLVLDKKPVEAPAKKS